MQVAQDQLPLTHFHASLGGIWHEHITVLFVLKLNVPVNNFSVMSRQSHLPGYYQYLQGVKFLAQGHNTVEVRFEPMTSHSGVGCSTTEPLRS